MNHHDHVTLLRPADLPPGGAWADLGAGSGAFTLALRELVGPEAELYAVDKDHSRLKELEREFHARFGDSPNLHILHADFTHALHTSTGFRKSRASGSGQNLPPLDGILMANSLHYYRDKESVLLHVRAFLKPGGRLLLVEYNVDLGNLWVPYPLSFETYRALAPQAGFSEVRLLATHSSSFLRGFYSAMAYKTGEVETQ
jgi:ubiquinone/menaquinone biosynthesis C-methylase UbiE